MDSEKIYSIQSSELDFRNFRTKVKEHLGVYKKDILNIQEEGIFNYKNKDASKSKQVSLEYILPKGKESMNITGKYRNDFFASCYGNRIKYHKYFHHLNSSQAMCINFFYPLIKENKLESFLNVIGLSGSINYNPDDIGFEKESELEENAQRKTNFDFYIRLNKDTHLYFEIKYTENKFGKAPNDDEHKKKFNNTYRTLLENNPAIKENFKTEEIFLKNYQLMRNLVHISGNSYVIFIYPKENKGIRKAALSAKGQMIEKGWEDHFILLTWEELIEQVKAWLNSQELINYYDNDFSDKYLKY